MVYKVANADSCAWLGLHPAGNIILQALSTSCRIIPSCLISVIFHCSHFLRFFALAERLMVEFHLAWSNCFRQNCFHSWVKQRISHRKRLHTWYLMAKMVRLSAVWLHDAASHTSKEAQSSASSIQKFGDPRGLHTFYVRGTDCILHNWTKVGQCSLLRFTPSPVHSIIYLKPCKVTVQYSWLFMIYYCHDVHNQLATGESKAHSI